MKPNLWKRLASLTLLCLLGTTLSAQPFQRLQAYGSAPRTGGYADVVCLDNPGANNQKVVALGNTFASPTEGLVTFMRADGSIVGVRSVIHKGGGTLEAEAICTMPNSDVIACFFDSTYNQTHVYRLLNNGNLVWKRRLPGFRAHDVVGGTTFFPFNQERIFMTGVSMANNNIALEALDGAGAGVFAYEYDISGPYGDSYGNEIHYNRLAQRLTMVGTVASDSCPRRDLLFLQTNTNGNLVVARNYYDPGPLPYADYEGKTLIPSVYNTSTFTLGFEYTDTDPFTGPYTKPGLLDIDAAGVRQWCFYYTDNMTGFFQGDGFRMGGLSSNDTSYVVSGEFQSFSNPAGQKSAYTLHVDRYGNGLTWNEYENTGIYPPNGTGFQDLEWDPDNNHYYIVGEFTAVSSTAGWPRGSDPQSFWAVATETDGLGDCSTDNLPWEMQLGPSQSVLSAVRSSLSKPYNSRTSLKTPSHRSVNQCGAMKQGAATELESEQGFEIAYLQDQRRFRVDLLEDPVVPCQVRLVNLQGVTLQAVEVQSRNTYLDASSLPGGVYLIVLEGDMLQPQARKVMVH